jgi:hypothetical protein
MSRDNPLIHKRGFWIVVGLIALTLLCITSSTFTSIYTDFLWFESLDFEQVLIRRIWAGVGLAATSAAIAVTYLVFNWSLLPYWIAPRDTLTQTNPFRARTGRNAKSKETITISTKPIRFLFTAIAVIVGLVVGLTLGQFWQPYLLATHGLPFNLNDPIFDLDLRFYVFRLPWYELLLGRIQLLLIIGFLGVLGRYMLFGQIKTRGVTAHLSLMGAAWLIVMGFERYLSRFKLLQSDLGAVFGAGYTDLHARLPLFTIEAVLFMVAALILIINLFSRQWKLLLGIGIFWVGLSLIGPVYPTTVQQFTVEPNEFSLERPYIEYNIAYTRMAYGLDKIKERSYPATGSISLEDLQANQDILRNVRLWDYRPLRRTYSQLQEIRLYYTFNNVDIDRYIIDGNLTEVMLAARELDVDELSEQAQTWINRHLIFTHGYGLTLNAVSSVTPEGLPRLLVRDIPPVSEAENLEITRPAIYFGERTDTYAIINTAEREFDYPQGDSNVYTRYEGPDGVPLANPLRRFLLAMRFNSSQMLLSSALDNESRILFHRTIQDRAETLAPMLWFDDDAYPVIVDGRIIWLIDAYTRTDHYPYSEPIEGLNYIRNSVKVTLDAYTGEIAFYLIDPEDPIAATYARIFPDLFRSGDEMPEAIRAHWRYPETLFVLQSQLYATYHMDDPQVFYNREDQWDIPQELVETSQQVMEPYYVTFRLPGNEELEFLLIRPYVPQQKQNMIAWFYARSDEENYGQIGVFKLAKDRLVYGPLQIEARTDQSPAISQQLSLWNQRGSRVLRGNLLVIPIDDAFIYVEPLYLEAESGQLPELKRVIVAYEDKVAMAPTLNDALIQVFQGSGNEGTAFDPDMTRSLEQLAQEALKHYESSQSCLATHDWGCYGIEQAQLESILRRMAEQSQGE